MTVPLNLGISPKIKIPSNIDMLSVPVHCSFNNIFENRKVDRTLKINTYVKLLYVHTRYHKKA